MYANLSGNPLEAIFLFPKEIDSVETKITCSITLQDGSKRFLETKIQSRQKAEVKFDDAVASGQTAILGSFTRTSKDMIIISVGNLPPMCFAELKIFYLSNLCLEDYSHCLRIPTTYIPRYVSEMSRIVKQANGGDVDMLEEEKKDHEAEML